MDLSALQAKAEASNPMPSVRILHGRTLYLDGDGLAYYCAGNDETSVAAARTRLRDKVNEMQRASSSERVIILLTGSGSHKGHRYAVARVKPYQGQRANSRRPKNWAALRDLLEAGEFGPTILDYDREADDRFGEFGHADPANTVIGTEDKDMRMVPGWHIDWKDNGMFYLEPGRYADQYNDKVYGPKWFWMQMLHGDGADFIPGVPRAHGKLCGPVAADRILAGTTSNDEAALAVHLAYESHYGERALVEMLEQAVLLWMRRGPDANWYDVTMPGAPLHRFFTGDIPCEYVEAFDEITSRINQAQELNDLSAKGQ